jgi:cephalosporin hydroxylase
VIHRLQPDVLIETGVAHGGSLILYATLFKAIGKGRIIGIDIEIRRHNRKAIESHSLASFITLVEGSSTDPIIVEKVKAYLRPEEKVLVILDACHSTDFVQRELEAYHQLVSVGSYIVATDGIMKDLYDTPRGKPAWTWDNPVAAARRFLETHPEFTMEQPPWLFSESTLSKNVTHWPSAYLKRLR